jgi:hypothetical protein
MNRTMTQFRHREKGIFRCASGDATTLTQKTRSRLEEEEEEECRLRLASDAPTLTSRIQILTRNSLHFTQLSATKYREWYLLFVSSSSNSERRRRGKICKEHLRKVADVGDGSFNMYLHFVPHSGLQNTTTQE